MVMGMESLGLGKFNGAIAKIMDAESAPVKALNVKKSKEEAKMKLLGDFKSKMDKIQTSLNEIATFKKFRSLTADLGGQDEFYAVTINNELAEPGDYDFTIDALAKSSSILTNGVPDPDALLGSSIIKVTLDDGTSFDYTFSSDVSSLRRMTAIINRMVSGPVQAVVIHDDKSVDKAWKMIISPREGSARDISDLEAIFFDADHELYIDQTHESQKAMLQVNGFEFESTTNTLKDFLPGVNLLLKKANPDQAMHLRIKEDVQKVTAKVQSLIESVNTVLEFIYKQNSVNERSDTTTTFAGDTLLQSIEYGLRNIIHRPIQIVHPATGQKLTASLNQFGIEFQKNGRIMFAQDKFQSILEKDFQWVAQIVTAPKGLVDSLQKLLSTAMRSNDGTLNIKEKGFQARVRALDQEIETKTERLEKRQQALVDRFARLESNINNMQKQQQYLGSVLGGTGNLLG